METASEATVIRQLLTRRFGRLVIVLGDVFDSVDPLDIVYPGNPGEYDQLIWELLVSALPLSGSFNDLGPGELEAALRLSLRRCFDDDAEESAIQELLQRLLLLDMEALSHE